MIAQLLTLVALAAVWVNLCDAASLLVRRPRGSPTRSQRLPRFVVPPGTLSVCPTMRCVGVDPKCQFMEVIAFRFEIGPSKDNWVDCLGCPYCIDVPEDYLDRAKRAAPAPSQPEAVDSATSMRTGPLPDNFRFRRAARRAHIKSATGQTELCSRVTCPVAPPDGRCEHPGTLEGYLRDRPCISCPACLDAN